MSEFYVYAPISGQVNSRWVSTGTCTSGSDYCEGTCHPAPWGTRPMDIGAYPGSEISFWSSPTIGGWSYPVLSIVVTKLASGACLNSSIPAPWKQGMKVEMRSGYNGAGALLGTLYYAHVNNPAEGAHDTINGGVTYIGYVPDSCPPCEFCQPDCICTQCQCYKGGHIHFERSGNSVHNDSISCSDSMIEGASWVYKYTY